MASARDRIVHDAGLCGFSYVGGEWVDLGGKHRTATDAYCSRALVRLNQRFRSDPTQGARRPMATRRTTVIGLNSSRRISKLNAFSLKASGGGSRATGTRESIIGDIGAIVGGAIGGETGERIGRGLGELGNQAFGPGDRPTTGGSGFASGGGTPTGCPGRLIKVGSQCIDPLALPPGGKPAIVPTSGTMVGGGGQAVMGGFGLPAMAPQAETRIVRRCGPGMVLGKDNLCYPKQILSRRSRFRKWRAAPRPPVTSADVAAIRRAARAKERVKGLAKDVGFSCKKK